MIGAVFTYDQDVRNVGEDEAIEDDRLLMISLSNIKGTFCPGVVIFNVTGIHVTRIVPSWGPESTRTSIGGSGRPGWRHFSFSANLLDLCDGLYFCDDGGGDDDEDDNYQHYEDDDQTDLLRVYETLYERRVSQEVWSGSSRQHTVTPGDQNSLRLFNMEMRNEEAFFAFFAQ